MLRVRITLRDTASLRLCAIFFLLTCFVFRNGNAEEQLSRAAIDTEFRDQLRKLADKCVELGLPEQAKQTNACLIERDPRRQYLFLAPAADSKPIQASDLESKWRTKLLELRRQHAARLFELARQQHMAGATTVVYQLLFEVLHHDPNQVEARRILGSLSATTRPRARQPQTTHQKYGWQRGKWWQIESAHFQIVTDAGQTAGIELANQLEDFHTAWQQLFFEYWSSAEWLAERFRGGAAVSPPERKHQVVFFRDRDEYVVQLSAAEPKISVTLGYYMKANRTSYFYAGDEIAVSVWYHETAHQLFQETGDPIRDVGEQWNFWVVEGIAVYLESAIRSDGYFTVGGFDADRLQFLRSRVMGGEKLIPFQELAALGRETLQRHSDIRRLYTQTAGIVHFLMDHQHGQHRDDFVRKLSLTYAGRDTPQTFLSIPILAPETWEKHLRDFLVVTEADLKFLGPANSRRNLSLAGAAISDQALRRLADSQQLEWLDLAYTPISDAGIRNLGPLPTLKRLTLVNTKITDEVAELLTPPALPCLEELDLSGTAVTDNALKSLSRLATLKVLRISHTEVTDRGLEHLANLTQLAELDVEHTRVTPDGLAKLKTKLPNLK